jgi:hypothetical protein
MIRCRGVPRRDNVKRLRFVIFLLIALVVVAGQAAAIDFGFQLGSVTEVDTRQDDEWFNSETLAAWLTHEFSQALSFQGQASYTFTTERPFLVDLDVLYLDGDTAAGEAMRLGGRIGRFQVREATGYVFDHRLDGGRFSISGRRSELTMATGYTGLLLKPTADLNMSRLDVIDEDDDDVVLAPSRLVGVAEWAFPEIVPSQNLTVSLVFQEDLRGEDDLVDEGTTEQQPGGGGRVDTQYTGVRFDGAIIGELFYSVFGVFQTGQTLSYVEDDDSATGFSYRYKPIFAGAGGAGVRYYNREVLSSRGGLNLLFGTGDDDHQSVVEGNTEDASNLFLPISGDTVGHVFQSGLGNTFSVHGFYSLKPLANAEARTVRELQVGLDGFAFFRLVEGPVPADGVRPAGEGSYLGSEIDASVNYRPFSDLGISLIGGVFFPNGADDGPIAEADQDPAFAMKLEASFSF